MRRTDAFSDCHPAVLFLYFALVIGFSMVMHPISLAISLLCALVYARQLRGRGAEISMRYVLPLMLLTALINPVFNRMGETVLLTFPGGAALTLESVLYGLAAAGTVCAVLLWFSCMNAVLSSDKLLALFGRRAPSLSLLLSMTLRFLPRFAARFRAVYDAQRGFSRGERRRLSTAAQVFSATVTWALEGAAATADSMRSRGYGAKNRTSYTPYRMDGRDWALTAHLCFCGIYLAAGLLSGAMAFEFYPRLSGSASSAQTGSFFAVQLLLCLTPLGARLWERKGAHAHG